MQEKNNMRHREGRELDRKAFLLPNEVDSDSVPCKTDVHLGPIYEEHHENFRLENLIST